MYNEDTFTCYKASVDKISDLKEIINSTILDSVRMFKIIKYLLLYSQDVNLKMMGL